MDHITVCIATCQRPHLLKKLLVSLMIQETQGEFSFSVVVVDNDIKLSAQDVVVEFQQKGLDVQYYVEEQKNIALARNLSVKQSHGDWIAFIDDDEFPGEQWLFELYFAAQRYKADIVHGPVFPYFVITPPRWVVCSEYFNPPAIETGSFEYQKMATNNCLVRSAVLKQTDTPFDPQWGLTGGEDACFFHGARAQGAIFVWCAEALVYENIGADRLNLGYFLRRWFRVGNTYILQKLQNVHFGIKIYHFIFSLFKLVLCLMVFPVFVLIGFFNFRLFREMFQKIISLSGQISAFFGFCYREYDRPVKSSDNGAERGSFQVIIISNGFQPHYIEHFANGLARNGAVVTLLGSDIYNPDRLVSGVNFLNIRGSHA
ncbi:MAG: glycosyltransferase, partial [Candidatus Moranbacteria bacterium]|nr:glycosyltransferase [Candidatus Moranbacteria bacterium]